MSLGPDDLILCAGTLAATPLVERIPCAAAAGFTGISIFGTDIERAAADGHSLADLKARIDDAGLRVAEIDPLASWFPSATVSGGLLGFTEAELFRIAQGLDARSVSAVVFAAEPPSHEELSESFAGLCDRARERGLLVHLEFIPFTPLRRLEDAVAIVDAVERPNAGVMLDVWHHFRGGGDTLQVERAAQKVLAVQLDDAPAEAEESLVEETTRRRLLPGDGDADVAGVIRALRVGGSKAPLGVEVFSDELAALPADEVARRAFEAVSRVVAMSKREPA